MSITFAAHNAPDVLSATYECQCVAYSDDGTPDPGCHDCQGEGTIEFHDPEGSFNVHNVGGAALCRILGLECEYGSGSLLAANFSSLRQAVLVARNSAQRRASETFDGYELAGGHAGHRIVNDGGVARIQRMGARVVSGGISDEYILRHLDNLDNLLEVAARYDSVMIHWG